MASLKLPIYTDHIDSERTSLSTNPLPFPANFSLSHLTSFPRASSTIASSSRFTPSRSPQIETQLQNKAKVRKHGLFVYDNGELDVNYSVLHSDLTSETCNFVLKRLERDSSEEKTLQFFEWMRKKKKLKGNQSAYNVILRVLTKKRDWQAAARTMKDAIDECGSELDFRLFNTLIYASCKQANVEQSSKWFKAMLELGIRPNVATFGMLMGLYQKGWNVREAEFVFGQMRILRIKCESAYSSMITIYTRLRLYGKAEEVIRFMMREDGVVMNLENWLVVINAYSQCGRMEEAEEMHESMREAGFRSNVVAYNMLITGYGKVSNMVDAGRVFAGMVDEGLEPDETSYRSMIEGWGRMGEYKKARWYYWELKRLGFKPNSSNLYTMINLQAAHGDDAGAMEAMEEMLEARCQRSSIVGAVLKAYERVGRMNKVPVLLQGGFYQHVLVNQTCCSVVVMAYVKNGMVGEAMQLLRAKRWKDATFEDSLYHLLICSCKEQGKLWNAVEVYEQMLESGRDRVPNLHISCTMIDVYATMGRFDEGEELYLSVKRSGIAMDLIAYSIVVRMYVKAGCLSKACAVLETMEKQNNVVPDVYLYRDMLRIYQRAGLSSKLKDLYYDVLKRELVWDEELYNCVVNCCANALPVNELSRLFDEMIRQGFAPNTVTFNVMLNVYGRSGQLERAEEVLQMARKRGLVDAISYNTIVAAYGRGKDLKKMATTVRVMQLDGFSVSLEAFNSMLDAYGKEGEIESFQNVLHRMKESSCEWDAYTYNIMLNVYGERGWIDEVEGVLSELRQCGLRPDICSYNTLIKAYGVAGMVEDAVGLVKEMRDNGVEPNKITYTNLIAALQKNDKYLESVKWSLWMKQMGL